MAENLTVDILDATGNKTGDAVLPAEIFDVALNVPLIHQVVVAQQAAARQGTHATKTRAQVSGVGVSHTNKREQGVPVRVQPAPLSLRVVE